MCSPFRAINEKLDHTIKLLERVIKTMSVDQVQVSEALDTLTADEAAETAAITDLDADVTAQFGALTAKVADLEAQVAAGQVAPDLQPLLDKITAIDAASKANAAALAGEKASIDPVPVAAG